MGQKKSKEHSGSLITAEQGDGPSIDNEFGCIVTKVDEWPGVLALSCSREVVVIY